MAKHSVLNRHWYQRQNTQYSTDVLSAYPMAESIPAWGQSSDELPHACHSTHLGPSHYARRAEEDGAQLCTQSALFVCYEVVCEVFCSFWSGLMWSEEDGAQPCTQSALIACYEVVCEVFCSFWSGLMWSEEGGVLLCTKSALFVCCGVVCEVFCFLWSGLL